ncbi:SixA phosphatase family protein [Melissospora conviva]|uniref:SixA phosphatase family protein n=1 Tax=Melissospora conviva TaxID=3388432 RepID=UPI003B81711B
MSDDEFPPRVLVLLRHATAEAPTGTPADLDRPLSPRGHAEAAAAGSWLAGKRRLPDEVICSPARRTRQTWHDVASAVADGGTDEQIPAPVIRYEPAVYRDPADELLDLVRGAAPDARTVLVVGHNPQISRLSALLASDTGGELPPSGIAVHEVTTQWAKLSPGSAPVTERHQPPVT